jgi:PhnB protein
MRLIPYLTFNGDCAEAFRFYAEVFDSKIDFIETHGETPIADEVPSDWSDAVIHAQMKVGDQVLMAADAPGDRYAKPSGFSISLQFDDTSKARRIFDTLAEGGAINMPLEETFWSPLFGMVVDRFGTPWMINCSQ